MCENSIFQQCTSIKSMAYDANNAKFRGFHTVWCCTGRECGRWLSPLNACRRYGSPAPAAQPLPVGPSSVDPLRRKLKMIRTIEAIVDEHGHVRLLEEIRLPELRRALVAILDEAPRTGISETALLSEPALAQDWERPEEDEAWSHLQPEP
jgi:hypothetical protein